MTKPLINGSSDKTAIALIQQDIFYIKNSIQEIKNSIQSSAIGFATKEQIASTAKETENRLINLEKSHTLWIWVSPTLSAVASSVLTYLLLFYFQHIK